MEITTRIKITRLTVELSPGAWKYECKAEGVMLGTDDQLLGPVSFGVKVCDQIKEDLEKILAKAGAVAYESDHEYDRKEPPKNPV